eukprot:s105_g8.t3
MVLAASVPYNDAPERIRGWSLMCGFQADGFRDWSDFAKFVDERATHAVKHLRQAHRSISDGKALPRVGRKNQPMPKRFCGDLRHIRSEPGLHAVYWGENGFPQSDFSAPATPIPASQVLESSSHEQPLDSIDDQPDARQSSSSSKKGSMAPPTGGDMRKEKRRGQSQLMPMPPLNHSPRQRYSGKALLETLPPIDGLDLTSVDTPTARVSISKGPQIHQLAHELRVPLDLVQSATEIFKRYSDGEGADLFQRKLRMSNFTKLLCANCLHREMHWSDAASNQMQSLSFAPMPSTEELTRVESLADLSPHFVETATRTVNRTGSDAIDVRDFFIWYSAFSFSEELTPNKEDHRTRRLAKKLGLEVVDVDDYRKAFDKFDADGSGMIEIDEFEDILRHLLKLPKETELEPNRVANLWRIADKNRDDVVDFEEFCLFWSRTLGAVLPADAEVYEGSGCVATSANGKIRLEQQNSEGHRPRAVPVASEQVVNIADGDSEGDRTPYAGLPDPMDAWFTDETPGKRQLEGSTVHFVRMDEDDSELVSYSIDATDDWFNDGGQSPVRVNEADTSRHAGKGGVIIKNLLAQEASSGPTSVELSPDLSPEASPIASESSLESSRRSSLTSEEEVSRQASAKLPLEASRDLCRALEANFNNAGTVSNVSMASNASNATKAADEDDGSPASVMTRQSSMGSGKGDKGMVMAPGKGKGGIKGPKGLKGKAGKALPAGKQGAESTVQAEAAAKAEAEQEKEKEKPEEAEKNEEKEKTEQSESAASQGKGPGKGPPAKGVAGKGPGKGPPGKGKAPPPPAKGDGKGGKGGKAAPKSKAAATPPRFVGHTPLGRRLHWAGAQYDEPSQQSVFHGLTSDVRFDPELLKAMLSTEAAEKPVLVGRRKSITKKAGITLLDGSRAQNLAIVMSKMKVSTEEFCQNLKDLHFSESFINPEDVELLIHVLPTPEESKKLLEYKDRVADLRDEPPADIGERSPREFQAQPCFRSFG